MVLAKDIVGHPHPPPGAQLPAITPQAEEPVVAAPFRWEQAILLIEVKTGAKGVPSTDYDPSRFRRENPLTTPATAGTRVVLHEDVQATRYGMGPNSALNPLRRFTITVLIHGHSMRIFHVNPSGVLVASRFDYGQNPEYLVGFFFAVTRCGSHALGYEKAFVRDDEYPTEVGGFSLKGLTYVETDDKHVPGPASNYPFDLNITVEGPNLAARPRPVMLTDSTIPEEPTTGIYSARSLFGSNPSVFKVNAVLRIAKTGQPSKRDLGHRDLVAKFTWEPKDHIPEAELLKWAAAKTIPNVAQVIGYGTAGELVEEGSAWAQLLRQAFARQLDPSIGNRQLRITVMPQYYPLVKVLDLRQFLSAFRSIIKGHHDLFRRADILHCDICPDNLMVDPQDHSRGVLIDFDHAIRPSTNEGGVGYISVGLRCMALDLLVLEDRPLHEYKHDLESFLWSFFDIVFNWSHGVRVKKKTNNDSWVCFPLETMRGVKRDFLSRVSDGGSNEIAQFCTQLGFPDLGLTNFAVQWSDSIKRGEALSYEDVRVGLKGVIAQYPRPRKSGPN